MIARALIAGIVFTTGAAAQSVLTTVPTPGGTDVAVDTVRNRIYVAGDEFNTVSIIDGASNRVSTVNVGRRPQFIAVNSRTNRIYTSNTRDSSLSVIDGDTLAVTTLPINGAGPIAIDERANTVYVVRRGNNGEVTILDGARNTWFAINTGSYVPEWLAVNEITSKLYVSHSVSGDVRVIDTTYNNTDHPATTSVQVAGRPTYLALNAPRNTLYVLSDDSRGPIVAIDGATNATVRITTPGHSGTPHAIAVNVATGRVYAAMGDEIVVVDGNSNSVAAYLPLSGVSRLAVDSAANRVYAIKGNTSVVAIDGATHAVTLVPLTTNPFAIAVNANTHRVYAVGATTSVVEGPAGSPTSQSFGPNLQGLWWNSPEGSESGWGLNIAHQGNTLFAVWFTYDVDFAPTWFVAPSLQRNGEWYSGDVYRTTGPAFGSGPFDPAAVKSSVVGNVTISPAGGETLLFSGTVAGVRVYKTIARQVFASPMPVCVAGASAGAQPSYQDIWWASPAGSESGWGVYLTHQGDNIFLTWFTYGSDGRPMWFVASNVARTGNATYSGTLYQTTGPPYTTFPFTPVRVSVTPVGSVTLTFSDPNNGRFTYAALGVSGSKPIIRQVFSSPATACR